MGSSWFLCVFVGGLRPSWNPSRPVVTDMQAFKRVSCSESRSCIRFLLAIIHQTAKFQQGNVHRLGFSLKQTKHKIFDLKYGYTVRFPHLVIILFNIVWCESFACSLDNYAFYSFRDILYHLLPVWKVAPAWLYFICNTPFTNLQFLMPFKLAFSCDLYVINLVNSNRMFHLGV